MKTYYLYITGNENRGKLSIDISDNLVRSLCSSEEIPEDNERNINYGSKLLYFEKAENIIAALKLKKEYESWNFVWKSLLINKFNPGWKNLFTELLYKNG
ncbi:MAG: hypothetical protein ABI462_00860 [Ignavibacteria bacterium]